MSFGVFLCYAAASGCQLIFTVIKHSMSCAQVSDIMATFVSLDLMNADPL